MKKYTKAVSTIYGNFAITEPLVIDLLESEAMQRLKKIYQFGVSCYVEKHYKDYTRYDHSIGVFALLRRYGLSLEEQIAGLLHDASHTVFSHVADYLFVENSSNKSSYQDNIHQWFLEKTDIAKIVAQHGYSVTDFMHKSGKFLALEQDLPDLCADRIEYILYEHAMTLGLDNKNQVRAQVERFLSHLHFAEGKWFFDDERIATEFAKIPLEFTESRWASDWGMYTYTIAAKMLRRALDINLITYDEIHFGTDDQVWEKLKACNDQAIQDCIDKICHYSNAYRVSGINDYNMHLVGKFRGVDPFVQTGRGLKRLSQLDQTFAKAFGTLKEQVQQGIYIKNLV